MLNLRISLLQRILDRMSTSVESLKTALVGGVNEPLATGEATVTVANVMDVEPPLFEEYGPSGWTNDPHVEVWARVDDAASGVVEVLVEVEVLVDAQADLYEAVSEHAMTYDAARDEYYYVASDPWADGRYRLTLTATDGAGNAASVVLGCGVDTRAPVFTNFSPEVTKDSTPTMIIVVIDDASGIDPSSVVLRIGTLVVHDAEYADGVIVYTLTDQVVGYVYITAQAGDLAGNTGTADFTMFVYP
jgi:hypothetical protein